MVLHNLHIVGGGQEKYIRINNGRLLLASSDTTRDYTNEPQLYFDQAIAFPGLINSHDHLDFNLFPQIGDRLYNNYAEWGATIHAMYKAEIDAVLRIPEHLRAQWGIYKNLLTGITTVIHHGKKMPVDSSIITVFQQGQSIHSVQGEKYWKFNLNKLYKISQPAVMHIGEGIDDTARQEIEQVIKWNLFKRPVIAIHGVAMTAKQAATFKALVWCPGSNRFMFGKTADIGTLKQHTKILFGTDSTLTASWNIWEHLRDALKENTTTGQEIFDMLTRNAAYIWNIKKTGQLITGYTADVVIAKPQSNAGNWNDFYSIDPKDILAVIHQGNIRLFDSTLLDQLTKNNIPVTGFSKVYIDGNCKYVQGDLPALIKEIRKYNNAAALPVSCD